MAALDGLAAAPEPSALFLRLAREGRVATAFLSATFDDIGTREALRRAGAVPP